MSLGIAKSFRDIFERIDELEKMGCTVGQTAALKVEGRYIYYLITKEKYNGKPTYNTLRLALFDLKRHMVSNGINEVAMPKIASGMDNLKWETVKQIIEEVFKDSNFKITVYYKKM